MYFKYFKIHKIDFKYAFSPLVCLLFLPCNHHSFLYVNYVSLIDVKLHFRMTYKSKSETKSNERHLHYNMSTTRGKKLISATSMRFKCETHTFNMIYDIRAEEYVAMFFRFCVHVHRKTSLLRRYL